VVVQDQTEMLLNLNHHPSAPLRMLRTFFSMASLDKICRLLLEA
jgi:hypothetical protein